MTPLLQQARGALENSAAILGRLVENPLGAYSITKTAKGARDCIAAIAVLDTYEALSPYDKAIEALAPYLPDGFVAQDEDGEICLFKQGEPHIHEKTVWIDGFAECIPLNVRCPDWRTSLRRIQGGRVVPQGEGGEDAR